MSSKFLQSSCGHIMYEEYLEKLESRFRDNFYSYYVSLHNNGYIDASTTYSRNMSIETFTSKQSNYIDSQSIQEGP